MSTHKQNDSKQKLFAVFDIDGTLIRWQLYHAVVDRLAKNQLLGKDAYEKLHTARMIWKRREHPEAFSDYEETLIEIYEQALPDITAEQFDEVADEVAQQYKEQVYTYTRKLIQDLKNKGYLLFAISGSHEELLQHIGQQYGFDDCVGSSYERHGSSFTGKKFIGSLDKRSVLKKLIKKHGVTIKGSVGVGDSKSDIAFLEMVDKPIVFNPEKQLFTHAKQKGWKIVVERKNMIYELENNNGTYLLTN